MKQLVTKLICTIFLVSLIQVTLGAEYQVRADEVALVLKKAQAGDRIVIQKGTYRDLELKWIGHGTEAAPIRIEAEEAGAIRISGASTLRIAGEWIEIAGLYFTDGYAPKGGVVEFRCGKEVANHCRLTNCAIDGYNPARRDVLYNYVALYGRHNRVDHCSLTRKLNLGLALYVILTEERSQQNFHRIDHNWFGPRPVYGSNGSETIRVGTSQQAYKSSNTVIEENLFDRCNGEVEVVSIKSCDNTVRNNGFWECEGVLALRHGDRNVASGNIFVGNGKRNTGGIRVVNAAHRIYDNRLYGLQGGRFFSALALMNAVPNSLPNRYCLVEDVQIERNLFVDCSNIEFGTGKDMERTLAPERILFSENQIFNSALQEPYLAIDRVEGFTFRDNEVALAGKVTQKGFRNVKAAYPKAPTYAELAAGCGASFLQPELLATEPCTFATKAIEVHDAATLLQAVDQATAGATIRLVGELFLIDRTIRVDKPLRIEAERVDGARPLVRFVGDRRENLLTIADGADLELAGICFSGQLEPGCSLPAAGVATAANMIEPYNLLIDDCEFVDFGESGMFAIKGGQATFAERVTIRRSLFRNLSGDAIHFAAERDDKGRYNADDMLIEDCAFFRILGLPINIYRGGSDESTAGPYVTIAGCNFEDCCNKERGSVIRAIGPQVMEIRDCNFSRSGRGGAAIRLDETTWEKISIHDCNLYEAGRILTMTNRVVTGPLTHHEPQYIDAERFDFRLKND